jgi:hypothetical protein
VVIPDAPSKGQFPWQKWAVCSTRTRFSAGLGALCVAIRADKPFMAENQMRVRRLFVGILIPCLLRLGKVGKIGLF